MDQLSTCFSLLFSSCRCFVPITTWSICMQSPTVIICTLNNRTVVNLLCLQAYEIISGQQVLDFRRLTSKFRVWAGHADVHLCLCVCVCVRVCEDCTCYRRARHADIWICLNPPVVILLTATHICFSDECCLLVIYVHKLVSYTPQRVENDCTVRGFCSVIVLV